MDSLPITGTFGAALEMAFNSTMAAALAAPTHTDDPIRQEWNSALNEYLRLAALVEANDSFGAMYVATLEWENTRGRLKDQYGKAWQSDPVAEKIGAVGVEAYRVASTNATRDFNRPFWDAERKLYSTPAPDLQAALFKIAMIKRDSLADDGDFDGAAMEAISADMARLAA